MHISGNIHKKINAFFSLRCFLVVLLMLTTTSINGQNASYPDCKAGPLATFPICNPSLPARQRAVDLPAATSFPMIISLGATFNMLLVNRITSTISTEARAFNNVGRAGLNLFTPNINVVRDP